MKSSVLTHVYLAHNLIGDGGVADLIAAGMRLVPYVRLSRPPPSARTHARTHARRCMQLGAIASADTEWQRLARRQLLAAARSQLALAAMLRRLCAVRTSSALKQLSLARNRLITKAGRVSAGWRSRVAATH